LHGSNFQRGGRRRRLLTEEVAATAGENSVAVSTATRVASPSIHKSANYGDAEFLDQQPRLTDLAPQGLISLAFLFLGGLTAIVGLGCLHACLPDLAAQTGSRLAALDLTAPRNLGHWFSSLLLLGAAAGALLVYAVRRHKTDDYHGRYRVWLWTAACWFLMATDSAANLHQLFQEIATAMTGTRITGDGAIWWIGAGLVLVAATTWRLLIDMWSCRLSTAALIFAWLCYLTGIGAHLGWLLPESSATLVLLRQGVKLTGDLSLLLAMALHLRYVLMDARGLLPRRGQEAKSATAKKRLAKATKIPDTANRAQEQSAASETARQQWPTSGPSAASSASTSAASLSISADRATTTVAKPGLISPKPTSQLASGSSSFSTLSKPAPAPESALSQEDADSDGSSGGQKLSKAERKALKKRLLEERLKREQRSAAKW
jgi:hypothetical protein